MGNEQSHEHAPPPEADDHTDLSDISDDRDPDSPSDEADGVPNAAPPAPARIDSPHIDTGGPKTPETDESRPRKRKKKRRRARQPPPVVDEHDPDSSPVPFGAPAPTPVTAVAKKVKLTHGEDARPLRDTEPETYHIYATSDSSDAEKNLTAFPSDRRHTISAEPREERQESKERQARRATTATPAPDLDRDGSRTATPEQVESDTAVPEQDESHRSNAISRDAPAVARARVPPATQTSIPPPKLTRDGRLCCPFAESHSCNQTFANKKGAVRHGGLHTGAFTCAVCNKSFARKDILLRHNKTHNAQVVGPDPIEAGHTQEIEVAEESRDHSGVFEMDHTTWGPMDPAVAAPRSNSASPPDGISVEIEAHDAHSAPEEAAAASEHPSSSQVSVFDAAEETLVADTPLQNGRLKRKRNVESVLETPHLPSNKPHKRLRRTSNSPPSSIHSGDPVDAWQESSRRGQVTDKIIPRLAGQRQSSLDGFAQKYTPGSNLRHPAFNPRTPDKATPARIEIVIPRTSHAGPSSPRAANARADPSETEGLRRLREQMQPRVHKVTYTTPKGKKRAEADVEYSTPDPRRDDGPGTSDDGTPEPSNLATSVARRTLGQSPSDSESSEVPQASGSEVSDWEDPGLGGSGSESTPAPQPAVVARAPPARRPAPPKKIKSTTTTKSLTTTKPTTKPKSTTTTKRKKEECDTCHRKFDSQRALAEHREQPSSHTGLYRCSGCSEKFWSKPLLARHEQESGHGKGDGMQGRTGAFTEREVKKLTDWRDFFCTDHNITEIQFNDMMTDTLKRGPNTKWTWPFISRGDFLKEYMDVLPYRNKRSMWRYRERNFQNVAGSANWTAAEDQELLRLHQELGPKWAEIGRRMTRTFDAVAQRWRHKLSNGRTDRTHATGDWTLAEEERFRDALATVRQKAGIPDTADWKVPWARVSELMGGRSAQQCSNHYRAQHGLREGATWLRKDAVGHTPSARRLPSRMDRRMAGEKLAARAEKPLSEEYVRDEDEDEDDDNDDDYDTETRTGSDKDVERVVGSDASAPTSASASAASEFARADDSTDAATSRVETESDADDEADVASAHPVRSSSPSSGRARPPMLSDKTPGKTLASSQLFAQTQANSSSTKASQNVRTEVHPRTSQDRPSPNIPIRRRAGSTSPLPELAPTDSPMAAGRDGASAEESTSSDEETSSATTSDSDETTSADSVSEPAPDSDDGGNKVVDNRADATTADDDDATSSSGVDDDDDEEEAAPTTKSGAAVHHARSGFMASIIASARRSQPATGPGVAKTDRFRAVNAGRSLPTPPARVRV